MPELPEMQALAERLDAALAGAAVTRVEPIGFTALKTVAPPPEALVGREVAGVGRRGKFCVVEIGGGLRLLFHLSQAGRVDLERPPKSTRPRGSVVRLVTGATGVLVREHGTQRKAGWWVLAPGDDGPLAGLGPEPDDPAFAKLVRTGDSPRRLHTWLRDQHVVAGIGRGYADDICHRAQRSPFATLRGLDAGRRAALLGAVEGVLGEALASERRREGGLSDARLGDRFSVHGRYGQPCPRCGEPLQRVSFESHEITYCPRCQTGGRPLADRRLSRLLR
ncbi:MAG: DNA-formamidopyrimidine glycosylase family protein [Acidimicrobiales bacterium]